MQFASPEASALEIGTTSHRSRVDWSNYYPRKLDTKKTLSDDYSARADRPPQMIHECSCLENHSGEQPELPVAMLDIPGASLFIAHWNWGFPELNVDYNMGHGESYDTDIKQRYPIEMYADAISFFASSSLGDFASTAAMFPDPMERMVAVYDLEPENNIRRLSRVCRRWDLRCYAARPGVANCMTKLMLGKAHLESMEFTELERNQSIQNLKALAFVAVEEEWNEAVCQFHRLFGGEPHQGAFRPNGYRTEPVKILDELRETYQADLDTNLYLAAKREFHERFLPEGDSQRCYRQREVQHSLSSCWPMSCQQIGKQCGEWADGCGGVLVCGQCPRGRYGLPHGWHVECSLEGQCIQTCPWWVENGIWFEDGTDLKVRLEQVGAPYDDDANEFTLIHRVTPLDAVQMCAEGCQRRSGEKMIAFVEKFCICGEKPDLFLAQAPKSSDYHDMADFFGQAFGLLDVKFPETLRKVHSQPKCCDAAAAVAPDDHWRTGTVEAEYFASFDMGCGKHEACAELGRQHGAQVVVFSASTSLCHLGRTPKIRL
ncbi:hypothetical protein MHU86_22851 [Fragilaria crotonensis]|nr:hypothetical protein MHU86_22851 [Fragilaria crotonensis]